MDNIIVSQSCIFATWQSLQYEIPQDHLRNPKFYLVYMFQIYQWFVSDQVPQQRAKKAHPKDILSRPVCDPPVSSVITRFLKSALKTLF